MSMVSNQGKMIDQINANSTDKEMARLKDTSKKVVGLNPITGKGFFSQNLCRSVLIQLAFSRICKL